MASFYYSKYGKVLAQMFASEWVRRANFFYKIWADAGFPDEFDYTEDHIESYVETAEWRDMMCEMGIHTPFFIRGMEVRHMVPTNVVPDE